MSPYAPPQAPSHAYGDYRPLGWKTRATQITIVASVVLGIAFVGSTSFVPQLQPGEQPTPQRLALALGVALLSLVLQVTSLLAGVFFLVWVHHAAKNVRAFGTEGLAFTPGWCVGWWFIPIASMWKPYQALKEVWKASDPEASASGRPGAWLTSPVPSTFPVWWGTYLVSGLFGLAGGVLSAIATLHEGDPALAQVLMAVGQFLALMSALAIVSIMRRLHERQEASGARLGRAVGHG